MSEQPNGNGSTVPETRTVGRPLRVLSDLERQRLTACAATGLNRELTSGRLGLSPTTLRRIIREDPESEQAWLVGRAECAEEALKLLWKQAKAGNPAAAIFLGKTLAGLRETGPFGEEGGGGERPLTIAFQVVTGGEVRELKHVTPDGEWSNGGDDDDAEGGQ